MQNDELKRKLAEVERQIGEIQKRISPMQGELRRLSEYREHILGVLQFEQGDSVSGLTAVVDFPRKRSGAPYWKAIADKYGYPVGADSAHRVVARNNPQLHTSIPHYCKVDHRQYP